jgi:putative membrane protein insertion efficiency factor
VKRARSNPLRTVAHVARELFLAPLLLYRRVISPALPQRCKYYPTCSTYGVQAVRELGVVRGTIVAAWRLARCNPWSNGGVDELADRRLFRDHHQSSQRAKPPADPRNAAT